MSSLAPETLLASQKAGLDAAFGSASRAMEGFEQLIDLNTRTLRDALDEHQQFVAKTFSTRDVQEFFALQSQHVQAGVQRVQGYWQSVFDIANGVRGVYLEAAQEQMHKSQRNAQALVTSFASGAPAGSEAVVNAWKSAIEAATESANSAYESAKKAARQVVEAAESNAVAASRSTARVTSKATATKK